MTAVAPVFDPLREPGWVESFRDFVELETRYCESDASQHINNVVYPAYLEHGLLKLLRRIGDPDPRSRFPFEHVTAELLVRYVAPSMYGETLRVGSKLVRVGRSSAIVEQVVLGPDGSVRAAARTAIVRSTGAATAPWTGEQSAALRAHAGDPAGPA